MRSCSIFGCLSEKSVEAMNYQVYLSPSSQVPFEVGKWSESYPSASRIINFQRFKIFCHKDETFLARSHLSSGLLQQRLYQHYSLITLVWRNTRRCYYTKMLLKSQIKAMKAKARESTKDVVLPSGGECKVDPRVCRHVVSRGSSLFNFIVFLLLCRCIKEQA